MAQVAEGPRSRVDFRFWDKALIALWPSTYRSNASARGASVYSRTKRGNMTFAASEDNCCQQIRGNYPSFAKRSRKVTMMFAPVV